MAVVDIIQAEERQDSTKARRSVPPQRQQDGYIWQLIHALFSAQARDYYAKTWQYVLNDWLILSEMIIVFIITEVWMKLVLPGLGLQSREPVPWAPYVERHYLLLGTPMGYAAMYTGLAGGVDYLWTKVWPEEGKRLKIQPTKHMTDEDLKKAWCFASKNIMSTPCLSGIFYGVMNGESNVYWGLPGLSDIPWFIVVYLTVDLMQYVLHRVMHRPWWYQRVHKVHHMWKAPNAWIVSALHPAEHLLYTAPMLMISCAAPLSFGTWLGFLLLVYVCSAMDHSGLHLDGLLINRLLFWQSPPEFHDRHHEFTNYNFGVMVDWWDRMCGTCYEVPKKSSCQDAAMPTTLLEREATLRQATQGDDDLKQLRSRQHQAAKAA